MSTARKQPQQSSAAQESHGRRLGRGLMMCAVMIRLILVAVLWLSSTAWAQARTNASPPTVKQPNEGAVRIYLATTDEAFACASRAGEDFGLDLAKAPDGTLFIASPGPWTRPYKGVTFVKTFIVRVRALNAKETEVAVEEEGKDAATLERVGAFHERLATLLSDSRAKKPVTPRHPQEAGIEPTVIKPIDFAAMRPIEDREELRVWNLGFDRQKPVNTAVWKLSGRVPLHFTPVSERRFLVTEGSLKLTVGNRTVWISAGDFALVPKAVRMQIDLEPHARATLFVVESPPVDESKTVWLEPKSGTTGSAQ
jgi:mannose-6-phosphate isomerase-like protein (cupin superfamily)